MVMPGKALPREGETRIGGSGESSSTLLSTPSAPASAVYPVYRQQKRLLHIYSLLTAVRTLIIVVAYFWKLEVSLVLVLLTMTAVVGYIWIIALAWRIADERAAPTETQER